MIGYLLSVLALLLTNDIGMPNDAIQKIKTNGSLATPHNVYGFLV